LNLGFLSFLVALFGFFLAFALKDDKGNWIYTAGYVLIYIGSFSFIVAFCWLAVLAVERWNGKGQ
jgi:hypothetical protein